MPLIFFSFFSSPTQETVQLQQVVNKFTLSLFSFLLTMTAVICWSRKTRMVESIPGIPAARYSHQGFLSLKGLTNHPLFILDGCDGCKERDTRVLYSIDEDGGSRESSSWRETQGMLSPGSATRGCYHWKGSQATHWSSSLSIPSDEDCGSCKSSGSRGLVKRVYVD